MLIAEEMARAHTEQRVRQAQLELRSRRLVMARRARRRAERTACRAAEAAAQAALAEALL